MGGASLPAENYLFPEFTLGIGAPPNMVAWSQEVLVLHDEHHGNLAVCVTSFLIYSTLSFGLTDQYHPDTTARDSVAYFGDMGPRGSVCDSVCVVSNEPYSQCRFDSGYHLR